MDIAQLKKLEIDLLLEAVYHRYGYDFRNYAKASIYRRINSILSITGCKNISDLIPKVIHSPDIFKTMLLEFSITVTEMFRDPGMYQVLRTTVLPYLSSFPSIKIWHAGCSSGQEAYSLAILLQEEGLNNKSIIYATDLNDEALKAGKNGIYDIKHAKGYSKNYQAAGGTGSFSDYYHAQYNAMVLNQNLKKNITFANHNLAIDGVFSEVHLICCRNVLIYFDKILQERVLNLFCNSLAENGFLCLGIRESLTCSSVMDQFITIDRKYKIFKKTNRKQHG